MIRICILLLLLTACTSSKKKSFDSSFEKDSDFLQDGHKVELVEVEKKQEVVIEKVKGLKKSEIQKKESDTKKAITLNKKSESKAVVLENDLDKLFYPGEEVVLSARYLSMEAGKVTIGVLPSKKINNKKAFHFYASGKTTSIFSLFYTVKNRIDALWDPSVKKPISLAINAYETKQKFKSRMYFDWKKRRADFLEEGWSKKKGDYTEKKTWRLPKAAQDIVSAIFYTRTFPLEVGKTYVYNIFNDAKTVSASLMVDRRESLKTRLGYFNTLVLKPRFKTKGKFKKTGDISIWVTDDEYRQVIRVESKIKIGTIVASLHSLKRPKFIK